MTATIDETAPLKRLWYYADGYRKRIIIASLWSFLNKAVDIAPPFLIGMAIDVVVNGSDSMLGRFGIESQRTQIITIAILSAIIWGLESIFEYLFGVEWRNLAQSIQHELRIDTYEHIQDLDVAFFEDRSTGDLMAVLNDDVNQLERFLDVGANEVIQLLTTVVLIGTAFFVIAPTVAWLAFLPVPVILWGSLVFQKRIEPKYAKVREEAASINSQLSNNLGGMTTIKAFTAEEREVTRIEGESLKYQEANRSAIKLSSAFTPLIRVAILFGFTAMLIWGGFLALDGSLNVGLYSVMVFLTQRLLWPLTRLGQTVDLYQRAMASTNRILDVLDTKPKILDGTGTLSREDASGAIEFNDVTFSYEPGYPVLSNASLSISPADTTAFVGSTGSGKTTIVKLLLRFYDPDSGEITIGGRNLRTLQQSELRQQISLVSQDVFLFHGTVAENIAYGVQEASHEKVVAAATAAEAHEFITELPQGYETIVGERGQKLSGGQRQRLSIARALLTEAPILILDEATSAVDNETEAAIQRSLARVSHNRTMIVIAHRLSTIRNADRIYVVDAGRVAEVGTHEELLASRGIYADLWDVQTGVVSL